MEKEGAIVLIDSLGTKNRWKSNKTFEEKKEFFDQWNEMIKFAETASKSSDILLFDFQVKSFSDTVLISFSTKTDSDGKSIPNIAILDYAGFFAGVFFILGLTKEFPFRGCISYGKFIENDQSIMGDPLIEASQYYDLPEWYGISLCPSAHEIVSKLPDFGESSGTSLHSLGLARCEIPLKIGDEKDGIAINLPHWYDITKKLLDANMLSHYLLPVDFNPSLEEHIYKMPKTTDISIEMKRRNTLSFIKNLRERKWK